MTENQSRDVIADKVRKLLAMATSANEHEALAFNEKAHTMLLENNMTVADIHKKAKVDEVTVFDNELETDPYPWRRTICNACAQMYLCTYYFTPERRNGKTRYDVHTFVGSQANTVVARMMAVYLMSTVDRLAKEGALKLVPKQRSPYRVAFRASCTLRVARRIYERIQDAKKGGVIKSSTTGNTLPALLGMYEQAAERNKKAIEDQVGPLGKEKRKKAPVHKHTLGAVEGARAGDTIGLDPQVEQKANALLGVG